MIQTATLCSRHRFIRCFPLLSFDQEAEDVESVADESEKSVKTRSKGTTPAPPQIKLESRGAALGSVPAGKMALILLINSLH